MNSSLLTANISEFTAWHLAILYTAVAVFYTSRIILTKNKLKRELVFPGKRFCSTWWNHMVFRFFRASIWMICLFRLPFPAVDNYLGMIESMHNFPTILAGNVLLLGGVSLAISINWKLGHHWRAGIDPNGPDNLISAHVYKYSRNPMFVGVAAAQLGFFLALPSVFSLICLLIGLAALQRQIHSEEAHLQQKFPQAYPAYCAQVPRWL